MEKLLATLLPGIGKGIRQSRREMLAACRRRSPVLIAGEQGTGKDHAAGIIHGLAAPGAPFRKIDLAFGGRVSGTTARGGATLYLDHAEKADGGAAAAVKEFASCRGKRLLILSVSTPPGENGRPAGILPRFAGSCSLVSLPPLRQRPEDIPLILGQMCRREGGERTLRLLPDDLEYLYRHTWPGNLTELRGWMDSRLASDGGRAAAIPTPRRHSLGTLLEQELDAWVGSLIGGGDGVTGILRKITGRIEKCVIRSVLDRTEWNQVAAADFLGINRNTLAQKIKLYGLSATVRRKPASHPSAES